MVQFDKQKGDFISIRDHVTKIYQNNHQKYGFGSKNPSMAELVVVKENDDWFRAKVIEINKIFTVLLIDEGNDFQSFIDAVFYRVSTSV